MNLRNLILLGACAALLPSSLSAQALRARPSASVLFQPAAAPVPADTVRLTKTYWKEGALITGIPSAIFGGALGVAFCHFDGAADRGSCVPGMISGAVLFGLIGAIPGALIGGQFDKPE